MKYELIFLQISEATSKEYFLAHIHNLLQIELKKGDTYNILFDKLLKRFKDESKIDSVKHWIEFNKSEQTDLSIFDTIICNKNNLYAIFDLIPIK